MKEKTFTGIFPALLTPFDRNGNVNRKALAELVRYNIGKGVSGFYVGGSTAEAFLLTDGEIWEAQQWPADSLMLPWYQYQPEQSEK